MSKIIYAKTAQDSVGYREAEDKKSFMNGYNVGVLQTENKFKEKINELERALTYSNNRANASVEDLRTIANILDNYRDKD